jgi:hypothetical protein
MTWRDKMTATATKAKKCDTFRMRGWRFFLGDPCYAFPADRPELWSGICDHLLFIGTDKSQIIPDVGGSGYSVLVFPTGNGDGVYLGSDGRKYGVDSGTLGLVPWEIIMWANRDRNIAVVMEELSRLGRIIENDADDLFCVNNAGKMKFGNITIDTRGKKWG